LEQWLSAAGATSPFRECEVQYCEAPLLSSDSGNLSGLCKAICKPLLGHYWAHFRPCLGIKTSQWPPKYASGSYLFLTLQYSPFAKLFDPLFTSHFTLAKKQNAEFTDGK